MLVAALLGHDGVPRNVVSRPLDRLAVEICHTDAIERENRNVAVSKEKNLARVFEQCRNIAGHKILSLSQANYGRRANARGNQFLRVLRGKKNERINATKAFESFSHRLFESHGLAVFLDQVGHNLRVGFRNKVVTFALQLFFQLEIILDDSVVDDHVLTRAIAVGVRVFLRWTPVCCPTRVAYAVGAVKRGLLNRFLEVAEFSGSAPNFKFAVCPNHGDAGRIVTAIFQFAQALDNDRNNFLRADVADNTAHSRSLLAGWT